MPPKDNGFIVKLNRQQQEMLIDLVEANPHLYDARSKDHRNKLLTVNTWKRISREMNVEGLDWDTCKEKWKGIRDAFNANRKKIKENTRSGSSAKTINKGQFHDRLHFLLGHVAEASTVSNLEESVKTTTTVAEHVDEENPYENDDNDEDNDALGSRSMQSYDFEERAYTQRSQSHEQVLDNRRSTMKPPRKRSMEMKKPMRSSYPDPSQPKKSNMHELFQKMNSDFEADSRKLDLLEKNIERKTSSFYLMMGEKMAKFPREQQVWMEDKIWNMYMSLEYMQATKSTSQPLSSTTNKSSCPASYTPVLLSTPSHHPFQCHRHLLQHTTDTSSFQTPCLPLIQSTTNTPLFPAQHKHLLQSTTDTGSTQNTPPFLHYFSR